MHTLILTTSYEVDKFYYKDVTNGETEADMLRGFSDMLSSHGFRYLHLELYVFDTSEKSSPKSLA